MNELVLLESRTARQDRLTDISDDRAIETINKAKALLMASWQGTGIATTAQMAEYYEVPEDTVQSTAKRNREELESDGLKTIKGKDLRSVVSIMDTTQNVRSSLTIWTPRAAIRLGMLLRDSLVAQQVRTVLLDSAEQQILRSEFEELKSIVLKSIATPQHKALPKASVDPVPGEIQPLTERQCITRIIRGYVHRYNTTQLGERKTQQEVTQWMYRELKYRHKFDVYARIKNSKYKRKIDLIEAEGYLPQLHAICNHFLAA
jgi:hypothetical protein